MIRDITPNYFLVQLPCGCTANTMEMEYSTPSKRRVMVVECQWCKTHYRTDELREWMGNTQYPIIMRSSPKLIKVKDIALEVVNACNGCGAPIVRVGGCKPFHLDVDGIDIERLVD